MEYNHAIAKIKEILSKNNSPKILQNCIDFLYEEFEKYSWIGIYLVKDNDLILGPWRGKQATEHIKIPIGKGICGSAAETGTTEIIADVSKDDRYLSCFISTRSEIVVPIKSNGKIIGEIDIDSEQPDAFNNNDAVFLEKIANLFSEYIENLN